MAQKTVLLSLFPQWDEESGQITLTCEDVKADSETFSETYNLTINTKEFDESLSAARKNPWHKSEEAITKAEELMVKLGESLVTEDGEPAPDADIFTEVISKRNDEDFDEYIYDLFADLHFDLYIEPRNFVASPNKIEGFIKADKITKMDAYDMRDGDLKDQVFPTVGGLRHFKGQRLQVFIKVPSLDEETGETVDKTFKVSQLVRKPLKRGDDEVRVSLRYLNSKLEKTIENAQKNERVPEDTRQRLLAGLQKKIDAAFQDKLEEINDVFGWDAEAMLEDHDQNFHVTVKVEDCEFRGEKGWWLIGYVQPEDLNLANAE